METTSPEREEGRHEQQMSRRRFLKGLGVGGAALVLAGCGSPAQPPAAEPTSAPAAAATSAPVATATSAPAAAATSAPAVTGQSELKILQWTNFVPALDDYFIAKAEEWGTANNVTVSVERINQNDIDTRLASAVQSQSGPDIFQHIFNWPWRFADQLVDVSDIAKELGDKLGGWHEGIDIYAKVEGVYLGIPLAFFPNAFVYRKSMWEEAGVSVPKTWDEFVAAAKTLKEFGKPIGQALGHSFGDPPTFWYPWLWAHGGKEVQEDGKTVAINSPETLKAVEAAVDLHNNGLATGALSWDDTSNNRAFLAGQISCALNGNSIYFTARDKFTEIFDDIGVFNMPEGPAGRFGLQATQTHGIMKYSQNQSAAKEFLLWFMQPEQYNTYLETGGGYYVGPLKAYDENPVWKTDERILPYREAAIGGFSKWPGWPGPPSRASSQALSRYIIVDLFAKAASGEFKPQEAVTWAEEQLKGIYEEQ